MSFTFSTVSYYLFLATTSIGVCVVTAFVLPKSGSNTLVNHPIPTHQQQLVEDVVQLQKIAALGGGAGGGGRQHAETSTIIRLQAAVENEVTTDVSIPYDSAARLAYDEWRVTYNKGEYDEERYQAFKSNYETVTIANVIAKKNAREKPTSEEPSLMVLNEFGDYTEAEYEKYLSDKAAGKVTTTGDILGQAAEAAMSQSEASSALDDAANALAEDEEKLAKELGLSSVEELEVAIDSMQGIAEDGSEIETDNIAREARVRMAYLEWCEEYDKSPDEDRFAVFSENFLTMEKFAKEAGKEMALNEYADCTKEEYEKVLKGETKKPPSFEETISSLAEKMVAKKEDADAGAPTSPIERAKAAAAKAAEAAKAAADAAEEAAKLRAAEFAKSQKERAAGMKAQAKMDAERRAQMEKERAARQKAQDKQLGGNVDENFLRDALKGSVRSAAKQQKVEARAARQTLKEARALEERQPKVTKSAATKPRVLSLFDSKKPSPAPVAAPKRTSPAPKSAPLFSFFSPGPKKATPAAPKIFPKAAPKAAPSPAPAFSFLSPPATKKKAAPVVAKTVAKKVSAPSFSFFSAPPKASPKASPAPKQAPAPTPAPLFSFFSPSPSAAPKVKDPPVVAKKTPSPAPVFSLFSPPTPKAAPPAPVTPPPAKKSSGFSFFGLGDPAPPAAQPTPAPAPKITPRKGATINLFNTGGGEKPAAPPKQDVPVPKQLGTINLFSAMTGSQSIPRPSVKVTPRPSVNIARKKKAVKSAPPAARGTISLFSAPEPKKAVKLPKRSGSFSLLSTPPKRKEQVVPKKVVAKKAAPKKMVVPKDVAILGRWTQNADGSITGIISNSKNFRTGTKITTSPVAQGAKAGSIVKTGSGSRYLLK